MERVSVLHSELSHPYKTAPCPRLVAELGLNLIYHKRIIRIGIRYVAGEMYRRLLVSHTEYHFIAVSVGETRHFAADTRISARLLPKRCGHNDGE